jgi:signal transduction histidine kinase
MPADDLYLYLVCFATGTVIHAAFTVLVVKLWRERQGPEYGNTYGDIREGVAVSIVTFLWQFGNFIVVLSLSAGYGESSLPFQTGLFIRDAVLVSFPLLFSYMCLHFQADGTAGRRLLEFAGLLRYPLWPWTIFVIVSLLLPYVGFSAVWMGELAGLPEFISLHLMLMYFAVFTVIGIVRRRDPVVAGIAAHARAHRAAAVAGVMALAMFVLMLGGYWRGRDPLLRYIELAAMMTSVPFTIATAYRFYRFPFMDVFVREVISGTILLAAFATGFGIATRLPAGLMGLCVAVWAMVAVYAKEPLSRWVERTFMGHQESVEQQEERVGNDIRALTRLDDFAGRVSEIVRAELDAEWVEIGSSHRPDAAYRFESLSLGPRIGGRQYMSRELRIARSAALQLAAHQHQLTQHELRELTARAQMRALQAQINPHFLFNTLNVLANLIHTNPAKAEHITEKLAEIFRYALDSTRLEWVKLNDELRFLESYLDIEKSRFEERLEYVFDIREEFRAMRIPPMILQPIVENAIKHGIGPKVEGGKVRVSARQDGDRIVLTVEDTGVGPAAKSRGRGAGIGLINVRERLQHVYGDFASLKLEEISSGGTRAVLVLPQLVGVHS